MLARSLTAAAAIWCVGAGVWIWAAPRGSHVVVPLPALGLLLPLAIAALGMWGAWHARAAAIAVAGGLMLLFAFVTGFSIGAAYVVPAASLFFAAVAEGDRAG